MNDLIIRSIALALAVVSLLATRGAAQESAQPRVAGFEVTLQLGFLTGIDVLIPSAGVGYRLRTSRQRLLIEAHIAHAPQNRTLVGRPLAMTFVGVFLHSRLRASSVSGVEPFVLVGIGVLHVNAQEECSLPRGCWHDGQTGTAVGGAGVLVPVRARMAIRSDLRLIVPVRSPFDDSASTPNDQVRPEFAAGLVYRW